METRVARRYAKAIFLSAQKENALSDVSSQLQQLSTVVTEGSFLLNPLVARDAKIKALDTALAGYHPLVHGLLKLLINKRREELFDVTLMEFEKLREEADGIVRISIQSAKPLEDDLRTALIRKFESETKCKVIADEKVDPYLVGGLLVQIGDNVFDGTVRGDLKRLRERFIHELARIT